MRIQKALISTLTLGASLAFIHGHTDISWGISEEEFEPQQTQQQWHTAEVVPETRATKPIQHGNQPNIHEISEAFGHYIGQDLNRQGVKFDLEAVLRGIEGGASGRPAPIEEAAYQTIVENLRDQCFQDKATCNLTLSDAFMEANSKREDILEVVPGKVQYTVLQPGRGHYVEDHTTPHLRFTGRYLDGTVLGATEGNSALPVPLAQMIPGFRHGVIGMREGEKRRVFIHPDLAYGVTGEVPPNSLLVFEIEVVQAGEQSSASAPRHHQRQRPVASNAPRAPKPRDSWDLSLDDDDDDFGGGYNDGFDDDFSTQRLVLEPVSPRSAAKSQHNTRQRTQQRHR